VHDERAGFEFDNQVFRAPLDCAHQLPTNGRFESRGDGPSQAAIADDQFGDAVSDKCGRNAASRRFYFRKLGQRRAGLFDLRFFIGDVLAHHGIEFLRLELIRMQALIFGGRVEVTGPGGRNQFDFVAHVQPLKP
jgi:hypothetical protein